ALGDEVFEKDAQIQQVRQARQRGVLIFHGNQKIADAGGHLAQPLANALRLALGHLSSIRNGPWHKSASSAPGENPPGRFSALIIPQSVKTVNLFVKEAFCE